MTEDEVAEWRRHLADVLKHHNLGWVIEQVEQHLRLGKTTEEEIQTFGERYSPAGSGERRSLSLPPVTYPRGRKARFLSTREYEAREALKVWIDAMEAAIADTAEMEAELRSQFSQGPQMETTLVREGSEPTVRTISHAEGATRADSAGKLRRLLQELKGEV
ncbi:MAG: hypothetical protein HY699_13700 [Deltaproteobacteria bacterium]|nr:hypothetical protein [Deltaproteobacteria bacterium]